MIRATQLLRILVALGWMLAAPALFAQIGVPPANDGGAGSDVPDFFDPSADFGGLAGFDGGAADDQLQVSGKFAVGEDGTGSLSVKAVLPANWHLYAMDQEGSLGAAEIVVGEVPGVELTSPFRPDREPLVRKVEYFEVPLREFHNQVTWTAAVRIADGVDPKSIPWKVVLNGQLCNDDVGCRPIADQKVPVEFAGPAAEPATTSPTAAKVMPPDATNADAANADAATAPGETAAGDSAAGNPAQPQSVAAIPTQVDPEPFRADRAHVAFTGQLQPAQVAPGGTLQLTLTAVCDEDWHIYAVEPQDLGGAYKPTLIALQSPAGWKISQPAASAEPTVKQLLDDEPPVRYFGGQVTWTAQVQVPQDASAGEIELVGLLGYQTCTDTGCDRPLGAEFRAAVTVAPGISDVATGLQFTPGSYATASQLASASAEQSPQVAGGPGSTEPEGGASGGGESGDSVTATTDEPGDAKEKYSFAAVLGFAFLGGLILNIMPCVFPVIGLKIMAFVQQAGEDRRQILMLNVWYAFGMILVFLVLATLAVVMNLGWGQQFSNQIFAITMTVVVFTMALSMLGVWEIPIPGFVGSGAASELGEREGPVGAISKGVLTTILATPCSGPGLAIALGYSQGKPASIVFPLFLMVGLGMASPYLAIGAFPRLLRVLPRPGQWMETFKQAMGFVLMGTVVYLLSFIQWVNVLPTIALLSGLGLTCWLIGRIPITADFQVKFRGWVVACCVSILVGLYAFGGVANIAGYTLYGLKSTMEHRMERDVDKLLATREGSQPGIPQLSTDHRDQILWHAYTEARLDRLIEAKQTVLIDFTADWCLTCKTLEAAVLDTAEVREVLRENEVVALVADWTNSEPEITRKLESLGSKQVPVIAIYPAGRADEPLVLKGAYTQPMLLDQLAAAGPSSTVADGGKDRVAIRETNR
jgi:suppressor for copper-sensitivity B